MQWGLTNFVHVNDETKQIQVFKKSFPHKCLAVTLTSINTQDKIYELDTVPQVLSFNSNSFTWINQLVNLNNATGFSRVQYISFGY